jgi:hypothetical protein
MLVSYNFLKRALPVRSAAKAQKQHLAAVFLRVHP